MTIFGVSWDELGLEDVEGFLVSAGGEGLTWEAKGTELPHPGTIAKHLCGFANAVDGGYLLLGVERSADGSWSASGLKFPAGDPPVWVTNIVQTLSPNPRVDVRDWQAESGRVAVVRIEPVAKPPCMTVGGQVFERVSGQTVPVVDPAELARLFGRGEVSEGRARMDAADAVHLSLIEHGSRFRFGVGLAAIEYEPGIERRLFRSRTQGYLRRRFMERLYPNRHARFQGARQEVRLDGLVAHMAGTANDTAWTVLMRRSGAVGVTAALNPDPEDLFGIEILMEHAVRAAWDVASDLVEEALQGSGRTAAAVRTAGELRISHGNNLGYLRELELEEWTAEPTPTGAELDHVRRQLLRSAGFQEWEPGDD